MAHLELLRRAVSDVVQKQAEIGLGMVNDGENGKAMRTQLDYGAWTSYVMQRLTGWEPDLRRRPQTHVGVSAETIRLLPGVRGAAQSGTCT